MASPTDISGLSYRFRASKLTGFANNASVASAAFENGGVTFTQPASGNQPVYISSSINGFAGLRFNGTSTYMSTGTLATSISQPYTISLVVNVAAASGRQIILDTSSAFVLMNDTAAGTYAYYAGTEIYGGTTSAAAHAITVVAASSSSATVYVDGVSVATGSAGAGAIGNLLIGAQSNATGFFTGDICELNVYNKALVASELVTLDTYVQSTYAITMADATTANISTSRFVRNNDLTSLVLANSGFMNANVQTASYTIARADVGSVIEMNVGSNNTVTIPANASISIPVGAIVDICQVGKGQTTIVGASGVTLDAPRGTATYAQFSTIRLRQRAANEWVLSGPTTFSYDPTTIGGLVYRMRASTIGMTTDGAAVSSAPFEVGGVTLSQPTAANQPIWHARGINGKPYISFNGSTTYLFLGSGAATYTQEVVVCVAAQVLDATSSQELFKAGGIEMLLNQSAATWSIYAGALVNGSVLYSEVQYFTGVFGAGGSTGSGQAYTNGVLNGIGGTGGNSTSGGDLYIGNHPSTPRYLNANVYEVLVYNATLSQTSLINLHNYMQATYL